MAYFKEEVIEEVRAANDIVEVISEYVHLQKKGAAYMGLCPFHNERTPSFSVQRERQTFHCFGCGAGGNVFTFLMQYENLSFPEAVKALADRAGIKLPESEMSAEQRREADRRAGLLEINKEAAKYYYTLLKNPQGRRASEYFKSRGLTDETIRHFGLGYSDRYGDDLYNYLKSRGYPDDLLKESGLVIFDEKRGGRDRFWNRAMFPIMDAGSRVIGFGGRVMGEGEPKYLNSPESAIFEKSRNMYGLNFARKSKRSGFLLCEGYMDVIALHQAGFDNAVASLGTAFTSGHANLLKRYAKEVCVSLDSDEPGVRAALRALPILKEAGLSARVADMKPYKDPDEFIKGLGPEEYEKRIESAENCFMFEIRILSGGYNLNDPGEKTDFFREVSRRLLRFTEKLERDNYIEAVAREYPVGVEQLSNMVAGEGSRKGLARERSPKREPPRGSAKKGLPSPSQSMLLSWLAEDPSVFDEVSSYVGPEDFTDPICRKAAEALFDQHARGEINPARIVSLFPDAEDERAAAAVFREKIPSRDGDLRIRQKALNEAVRRVKQDSIDAKSAARDPSDVAALQKIIEEKKKLDHIHIRVE